MFASGCHLLLPPFSCRTLRSSPTKLIHIVLTVGENNVVTPKLVQVGDLRGNLRVIRSGLSVTDKVIIDGIPTARPGSAVSPTGAKIDLASNEAKD